MIVTCTVATFIDNIAASRSYSLKSYLSSQNTKCDDSCIQDALFSQQHLEDDSVGFFIESVWQRTSHPGSLDGFSLASAVSVCK